MDQKNGIPIVAIGASAGGLEPLEAFFAKAPTDKGWCYVVIQHLSPDYRSMMDELLARRTDLVIRHIDDGVEIAPDTIFLNRPNTKTVLEDGMFRTETFDPGGSSLHLPIDSLFGSLAQRPGEQTAAVILSGSGSDGASGAQLLHSAGGAVLVQTPAQAEFPSMPRSVLATGAVDHIVDVKDMALVIAKIFETGHRNVDLGRVADLGINRSILSILEQQHHLDFTPYKEINVQRRITRRQHLRGLTTGEEYLDLLRREPAAVDELFQDLLIGVTKFYREPDSIEILRQQVFDRLARDDEETGPIRVWVAGCASGEEAYTLAMEINEAMENAGSLRGFRIMATDVHRHSVDIASRGYYSADAVRAVPAEKREKYFVPDGDGFSIVPALRKKIIFSVHDVLTDPPFLDLDLVSCQNLLIYLRGEAQARVISMFLFGLKKDGTILLGPSETLGRYEDEFKVINSRWRLFRKASSRRIFDRSMLPERIGNRVQRPLPDFAAAREEKSVPPALREFAEMRGREALVRAYDALLKSYAPSSILVNSNSEVLSWFGTASTFIDTRNHMAEWTVEDIVHSDLHFVINLALEKLRSGGIEAFSRQVDVDLGKGKIQGCTLTFEPLDQVHKPQLLLVRIRLAGSGEEARAAEPRSAEGVGAEDVSLMSRRIHELERDLKLTEETLQHVTERLEASGEELQASNEELQASNEELQASNEELQSSNEELHAVNEELVTVSSEHEQKIELLSALNRETEHLFKGLRLGIVFVDQDSRMKRFSDLVAQRFQLEAHDVNRKLDVVGPRLDFVDLPKFARDSLENGVAASTEGVHNHTRLRVEAMPVVETAANGAASGVFLIFHELGEA
ncbi:CheR family methyltransferase [Maritimibacter dapengensis]|uniref:CheR family methyltransferase n=1 Tax=Maritimibacter dapengensis TaxID=2836868 RepID=UPI00300CD906